VDGPLSLARAEEWIFANAFDSDRVGTVGTELEWICRDVREPARRVPIGRLHALLADLSGALPGGGAMSLEPGGQVELSSAPASRLGDCLVGTRDDVLVVRAACDDHGLSLRGVGLDDRIPERIVELPRYRALEAHYASFGPHGKTVMCNAASVQVCLDAGDDSSGWYGRERRWWLVNALGPVLAAMFANSPDRATGWRSTRLVLRMRTDPSRTLPLRLAGDPRVAWIRYALDASVVGIGSGRLSMRRWLGGEGPRPAYLEDLRLHLKTVIPPVRACGHLELRMIDAQRDDDWLIPVAVVSALVDDPVAADRAAEAIDGLDSPEDEETWLRAAQYGLSWPPLARAAAAGMAVALDSLTRTGAPEWVRAEVAGFAERYTERGLSPADLSLTGEPVSLR